MPTVAEKKAAYAEKVTDLLGRYSQAFLVHADNVGSLQIQKIRIALRQHNSTLLFGKNTLMKKCVRNYLTKTGDDKWACVPEMLVGNVGLLFIDGDMTDITALVKEYNMPAPARVGAIAPCDVVVSAGPTGMDPSQTSFFQALNVTTKITKGSVEITSDVKVLTAGQKVGGSEAVLLQKMGMKPFEYGLVILEVIENGTHYSAKVLELSDDDLQERFNAGLANVTALAMETKSPALCTVPHHIINQTKEVLALVLGLDTYSFPLADKVKDTLAKIASGEFVCAAPAAAAGGAAPAAAAAAPEPEEEEEEDMGFDLFD